MLRQLLPVEPLYAATFEIFPSNADTTCNEEFENVANKLQPGDELVLRGGTYTQACRRLITGRNGTLANPIIIRAATGENPILTRPLGTRENNIEIQNSSFLIIRGLKFRGGETGVRFMSGTSNITFEDNEVYDVDGNGITMNSGSTDSLTVRRNHIHDTGRIPTFAAEAMYIGCHDGSCIASNHLIENNYIHHLRGDSNDGIEVKYRSFGNIIRNNVIHDTNVGSGYPCIFVYGGGTAVNVVEGNAVWNCGEGLYAVSDAVIRNNIVFDSGNGIASYPHAAVPQMRNLSVINNTVYNGADCLFLRWSGAANMILANNAVYCAGRNALNASGIGGSTITARSNYLEGNLTGASIDNIRFFSGGTATNAFVNPAGWDFWPSANSILRNAANASYVPTLDFNETPRTSPYDVGAYETEGLTFNPGWKIVSGLKATGAQKMPPAAPSHLRVQD